MKKITAVVIVILTTASRLRLFDPSLGGISLYHFSGYLTRNAKPVRTSRESPGLGKRKFNYDFAYFSEYLEQEKIVQYTIIASIIMGNDGGGGWWGSVAYSLPGKFLNFPKKK